MAKFLTLSEDIMININHISIIEFFEISDQNFSIQIVLQNQFFALIKITNSDKSNVLSKKNIKDGFRSFITTPNSNVDINNISNFGNSVKFILTESGYTR